MASETSSKQSVNLEPLVLKQDRILMVKLSLKTQLYINKGNGQGYVKGLKGIISNCTRMKLNKGMGGVSVEEHLPSK